MTGTTATRMCDIRIDSALNDGTRVQLRCITPADEPRIRAAIAELSAQSRYLRFFTPTPELPSAVTRRLAAVDGHDHIGWGAICLDCGDWPAIGAVHAVRHADGAPDGEFSVAVVDAFHGKGVARMLTAALLLQCLAEDLVSLDVHMLSENDAARRLVKSLGATWESESAGVAEYRLDVANGLASLRSDPGAGGVEDVFAALAAL